MFHVLTTEVTPKYERMKMAEQSSSPCLAVTVWGQPSAWSGRRSRAQLLHPVRTPDEPSAVFIPSGGIHLLFPSLEGHFLAMGVYQSFVDSPTSAWCALPHEHSFLAMRLDKRALVGSSHTLATLYRWQGAFVAVEVG